MKTLRLIGMAIVAVMLCFNFTACSSDNEVEPVGPQKPKEYTVSLGFTGEVSISESPLSRTSGNDLYGIQVYSCPNVDGATTYSYYAYGLFDDTSAMTIKLMEGYKYKFEATMVVDGKNSIHSINNQTKFTSPFSQIGKYNELNNVFTYSTSEYIPLYSGYAKFYFNGKSVNNNHATIDRYYGEYLDYFPKNDGIVDINMKRTVFGVRYVVEEFTEGTINIAMEYTPKMSITYPNKEIDYIINFFEQNKAYANNEFTETIPTTITWTKADGVVVPLGTHNITFKRNVQPTVTIKVADVTTENGIGIELESAEMGADNITIENGEIVDTDVETEIGEQ